MRFSYSVSIFVHKSFIFIFKCLLRNFYALQLVLQFFKDFKKTQGNSGMLLVTQGRFFDSKSGNPVCNWEEISL